VKGGYALDVDSAFDKDHFCHSGRQVAQAKNEIVPHIATYQPDYVLVALGFNDLGWWINGPDGLLLDMKTLIDNVRGQKSNVKFAIANVPHRTRINGRQDLIDNTITYNSMLASSIPGWSTTNSPIHLVQFNENYKCKPFLTLFTEPPSGWVGTDNMLPQADRTAVQPASMAYTPTNSESTKLLKPFLACSIATTGSALALSMFLAIFRLRHVRCRLTS
jgi:hypothetical protein